MATFTPNQYTQRIWNYLLNIIGNEKGVAGMMGNLYYESHCYPNIVFGDTAPPTSISLDYTADVDDGTTSENAFTTDGKAYGLAQWLSSGRKKNLYEAPWGGTTPSSSSSIGSISRALSMINYELNNGYKSTKTALTNATSIDKATTYVYNYYEGLIGSGDTTLDTRKQYAKQIYDTYSGGSSGEYQLIMNVTGNGTAYTIPTSVNTNDEYKLYVNPASGNISDLLTLEAREADPPYYSVALSFQIGEQTVTMRSHCDIIFTVEFTGSTPTPPEPPIPPTPTPSRRKKKGMPIWMYPRFKRR